MPGFFASLRMTTMTFFGKYPKGMIEREKSVSRRIITLREPTRPMHTEAAAAGFCESRDFPGRYPRLQILTIGGCRRHRFLMALDIRLAVARPIRPRSAGPRFIGAGPRQAGAGCPCYVRGAARLASCGCSALC